ncbi:MAG: mechanosensitive ion channel family protein [Thiohalocapsa sp.]
MQRDRLPQLIPAIGLLFLFSVSSMAAQAGDEPPPEPVTIEDSSVPVEELELLLKPLTKSQLLIEADAWQGLLQTKSEDISQAEIAVRRQNREIDEAEQAAQEVAAAAAEAADNPVVSADDAVATDADADSATDSVTDQATAAMADIAPVLDESARVLDERMEAMKQEKVALLATVVEMREKRTVLLDQYKAVITALETKTDENDADTLAKIQDYKLYAAALRGADLDVKDTHSALLALKAWIASDEGGKRWAINLANFFGILFAAWIISGIFSGLIHRAIHRMPGTSKLLEDFLVKVARWVVLAIGLIMALAALEVSVGPLLALVGAAGFVVAFALQDSLSNFASGLMILLFKPFDVGDVVDAGGVSGSVESVNLVSTTIKTFDNKKVVVPNNKVWGDVITNASGLTERRVDLEFGIGYDDDIDQAQAILEEIVGAHPNVLQEPAPTIRMSALADSSVNFIVRPWTNTADYWGVYWDVTREVKKRFDAAGIGIPFPQRDVHLYIADGGEKLTALRKDRVPGTAPKAADGGLDD